MEKMIEKFRDFVDANADKRVLLLTGGKNTGKSTFMLQENLMSLYKYEDMKNIMVRATGPDLEDSMFEPSMEMLTRWGIPFTPKRSHAHQMIYANGSALMFRSMQTQQTRHKKFSSINVNDAAIEEAPELTWGEFNSVDLQVRRENRYRPNRIMMCANTDNPHSWVRTVIAEGNRNDVAVLYTTVYDNPFATDEQIKLLEDLKDQNMSLYRAYCLGEWAAPEGVVYSNYDISAENWPEQFDEEIIGQDVGTVNPMATVSIGLLDERPWEAWIRLLLYQSGMTDGDLADWYSEDINKPDEDPRPRINKKIWIYCDTDPGTIETLSRKGYHVFPADKKSVASRLRFVSRYRLHFHPDDADIKREVRGYVRMQDRNGNFAEEPVKRNDHAMNAMEYGLYTHAQRMRVRAGIL